MTRGVEKREFSVRFFLNEREFREADARAQSYGMRLPAYARRRVTGMAASQEESAAIKRARRPVSIEEAELIRLATLLAYELDAIARYLDEIRLFQTPGNWGALELILCDMARQMKPLRDLCLRNED